MTGNMQRRVAVVQDGARLHYAVPLAFNRAGLLERMFAEWYPTRGSAESAATRLVGFFNRAAGMKLASRRCPELPDDRVVRNPGLALHLRLARKRFRDDPAYYEWCSVQVAAWIRATGWGEANTLFGFVRNVHPSLCEAARREGLTVVADQIIAPARIEEQCFLIERDRWPDWVVDRPVADLSLVRDIEERTWATSDHLTCASEFVRGGLLECGVPADRISVIPYPIQSGDFESDRARSRGGTVTVGFVGSVGVRKGAPYFLSVARRLAGKGVRFVMAGPISIPEQAQTKLRQSVELTGALPRSQIREFLGEIDIFFFPSTCEGSAGAVMEAMAAGLPVVTTPNSGSLVVDGVHGFVRHHDDLDGLAGAVERLSRDPELRVEMGRASRDEARRNTLDVFVHRLTACLDSMALPVIRNGALAT